MTKDDLHDFQRTSFTWEGTRHDVFRRGSGPAVLVTSETPGITPNVANFARRVCDRGLTAIVPQLLGVPGKAWTWPYVIPRRPERGHAGEGLVEVKPRRARRRPTWIMGVGCRITATQRPGRRRQGAAGS